MIGLAGVALTVSGGMQGGQAALPGVLMILAAAFSYGLGGVIAKVALLVLALRRGGRWPRRKRRRASRT